MVLCRRVLVYRVLLGASLTVLYSRLNRFSEFLRGF
jgi:hypothetical protein